MAWQIQACGLRKCDDEELKPMLFNRKRRGKLIHVSKRLIHYKCKNYRAYVYLNTHAAIKVIQKHTLVRVCLTFSLRILSHLWPSPGGTQVLQQCEKGRLAPVILSSIQNSSHLGQWMCSKPFKTHPYVHLQQCTPWLMAHLLTFQTSQGGLHFLLL